MRGMTKRPESLIRAQKKYDGETVKLNVRLSTDERDRLEELALQAGVRPTTLIKQWIAKAPGS